MANLDVHHRPIHHWKDPQVVVTELENYYTSKDCPTEKGFMPSSRELLMAKRGDLRYALSVRPRM